MQEILQGAGLLEALGTLEGNDADGDDREDDADGNDDDEEEEEDELTAAFAKAGIN